MARTKKPPISPQDKAVVGSLLRDLRRASGYRSVEAVASLERCPASRQTIYSYERGSLTPSLHQFLELIEFYVLEAPPGPGAKSDADLRAFGVAAVTHALTLPAYNMVEAMRLIARMRPDTWNRM
jgi:transcriptional regulator with XRE-family HTH domain